MGCTVSWKHNTVVYMLGTSCVQCLKLIVAQSSLSAKNWAAPGKLTLASKNCDRWYKEGNFLYISGRLRENFSLKHCGQWFWKWRFKIKSYQNFLHSYCAGKCMSFDSYLVLFALFGFVYYVCCQVICTIFLLVNECMFSCYFFFFFFKFVVYSALMYYNSTLLLLGDVIGIYKCNLRNNLQIKFMSTSGEIAFRRMPQTFDDKSTLVQVMALCHQATNLCLSHHGPNLCCFMAQ